MKCKRLAFMKKYFSVARDQMLIFFYFLFFFLWHFYHHLKDLATFFLLNNTISLNKPSYFFCYFQMMWKPAYDFLYTWAAHYGYSYRDVLQDLQSALDKTKNPVTKHWRELTGTLILVNCMEVLRASAFSKMEEE